MRDSKSVSFLHALGMVFIANELQYANTLRNLDPNGPDWQTAEIKADLLQIAVNAICGNTEETAAAIAGITRFANDILATNVD